MGGLALSWTTPAVQSCRGHFQPASANPAGHLRGTSVPACRQPHPCRRLAGEAALRRSGLRHWAHVPRSAPGQAPTRAGATPSGGFLAGESMTGLLGALGQRASPERWPPGACVSMCQGIPSPAPLRHLGVIPRGPRICFSWTQQCHPPSLGSRLSMPGQARRRGDARFAGSIGGSR